MNCDHWKSKLAAVVICLASLSQTSAAPAAPRLNDVRGLRGQGPTASVSSADTQDGATGNNQAENLKSPSTEARSGVPTTSTSTSASSAHADAVTSDAVTTVAVTTVAVTPEGAVTIGSVHASDGKAASNAASDRDATNPAGGTGDKSGASVAHAPPPQGNGGESGAVAAGANQGDGDTGKAGALPAAPSPEVNSAPDKVNRGSPKVTDGPGVSSSVASIKNGDIPVPTQAPVTPSQSVVDSRQQQIQPGPVPTRAPVPPLQPEPVGDAPGQQAAGGPQSAAPAPAQDSGDPAPAAAAATGVGAGAGAVYPGREKSPDGEQSPKNAASESKDIAKEPTSASASESAMRAAAASAAAAAGNVADKPAVSETLPEEEGDNKLPSSAAEKPPVVEEVPPGAREPPPSRPTASAPQAALPEPHYPDSGEDGSPTVGGSRGGDDDFSINELQPVYKAPSGFRPGLDQQPGLGPYVGGALPAQGGDSNFFAYFLTAVVLCIALYLAFHNKQKILALVIEGRNSGGRRRPHSSQYRRLDTSLEEAISSQQRREVANSIVY